MFLYKFRTNSTLCFHRQLHLLVLLTSSADRTETVLYWMAADQVAHMTCLLNIDHWTQNLVITNNPTTYSDACLFVFNDSISSNPVLLSGYPRLARGSAPWLRGYSQPLEPPPPVDGLPKTPQVIQVSHWAKVGQ